MAATRFGRSAVGDPGYVTRLRNGARSWPETQQKCLDFIENHKKNSECSASSTEAL